MHQCTEVSLKEDLHAYWSVLVLKVKRRTEVTYQEQMQLKDVLCYGGYLRTVHTGKNIFLIDLDGPSESSNVLSSRSDSSEKKKSFKETRKQFSSSTRNSQTEKWKNWILGQLLNGVYPVFLTKLRSTPFSACIAERFHGNAIFREQFHESIWRRLEKHFSSLNNALRRYLVVRRFPKPRSKFNFV